MSSDCRDAPEQVIEFGPEDWGGHADKHDQPGIPFVINGARCTLFSVEGSGKSWDGRDLFAIVFRKEDSLRRSAEYVAVSQCDKCRLLGCTRGPGFADLANDPPSKWRCPCGCHPVNQVPHAPDCDCLRYGRNDE